MRKLMGLLGATFLTGCLVTSAPPGGGGTVTTPVCTPGTTQACACPGAILGGAQACNAAGTGYDVCACSTTVADSGVTTVVDAGSPVTLPSTVAIAIIDSTFAPFKAGGRAWDGNGQADQQAIDALAGVVARIGPYGAAAAAIATIATRLALPTLAMPDPYGSGELYTGGRWQAPLDLATEDNNAEDRFFTTWPMVPSRADPSVRVSPGWVHVPLAADLQVRLHLYDCDYPLTADAMGNPVLRYEDILQALRMRQTLQVNVGAQTNNQVVTIGLSVTAE